MPESETLSNSVKCFKCGKEGGIIYKHHTSYNPEVLVDCCISCHSKIHHRIRKENTCSIPVDEVAKLSSRSSYIRNITRADQSTYYKNRKLNGYEYSNNPKRIWIKAEKIKTPSYFSIRWGLGQFDEASVKIEGNRYGYCPKLYIIRTYPLCGEYYIVEGRSSKAKPVEPEIRFRATMSEQLDLRRGVFKKGSNGLTFPELALGICGATFEQLRDELLRLNKKATLDTPFFVSKLEPVE